LGLIEHSLSIESGEIMRRLLLRLIPLLLVTMPLASFGEQERGVAKPAIYAIQMHADWCGACKALDPKVEQARLDAQLDMKDVLFITLDLTNETTQAQSAMMAAALGISDIYNRNTGKTGFMLIINSATGQKIDRLTSKADSDEIAKRILDTLETVRS